MKAIELRNLWSSLLRSTAANIALSTAIAIPAVFGCVGSAVDYSVYLSKVGKLQATADAAALAAASELSIATVKRNSVATIAENYVNAQLLGNDVTATAKVNAQASVTVELTESWSPVFAEYIGLDVTPIHAKATAGLAGSSSNAGICVLALDPEKAKAIFMDISPTLTAKDCGVYSASKDSESIRLDAKAKITAALVCAAGGTAGKVSAYQPKALSDCPVPPDPLASRAPPPVGSCDHNNVDLDKGSATLSPGVYCNGLKIAGTAKVTFQPGTYVVKGGKFEISGHAQVTGDGVGFYLSGDGATLQFTEDTTLALEGAKSGPLAGLLFFEDRATPLYREHRINSINAHKLTGTIYLSRGRLRVDPNSSVAQNSAYTAIIVRELELKEGPNLFLNANYDSSDVPIPEGIRVKAEVRLLN